MIELPKIYYNRVCRVEDVEAYGKACAAEAREQMREERVPMTYEQALAINPKGYTVNEIFAFRCGLRAAEAHHGITPPESKG